MSNIFQILKQYASPVDIEEVTGKVGEILAVSADNYSYENLKLIYSVIDLTSLNSTDNESKIKAICTKINEFANHYPDLPNVAGICVFPSLAGCAKYYLKVPSVRVVSVAGGFPFSQTFFEIREQEARLAVKAGASEIDMLLNVGKFLEGNANAVFGEIQKLKTSIGKIRLKVILETGALKTLDNIKAASIIAMEAGADFIKTSTGKLETSATPEAVYVIAKAIKEFYLRTGVKVGIKPSGGISTCEDALIYFTIIKKVLGDSWLNPKLFRIGASRLTNNVLLELEKLRPETSTI
ncbi:MAG: deoxyribose-phosphate aldolase [Bacteroidia bacterium]|nr:deoxyribose-phosphate aldolase [Bacteroidia bacterium]